MGIGTPSLYRSDDNEALFDESTVRRVVGGWGRDGVFLLIRCYSIWMLGTISSIFTITTITTIIVHLSLGKPHL